MPSDDDDDDDDDDDASGTQRLCWMNESPASEPQQTTVAPWRFGLAVWCSGNALVSINAVALHRAWLVLGWVTAFGQVNYLIT